MRQLKVTERITVRTGHIEKYMNEMARCEVLSAESEAQIAERAKAGDMEAREILIKSSARFVVSVAKQYQHNTVELSDLIAAGNIGLIMAADKFDVSKGFKFISYAVWWIREEILKYINQDSRLIRLPGNSSVEMSKCRKVIDRYYAETGDVITYPAAAQMLGLSVNRIDLANRSTALTHIDRPSPEDENTSISDYVLPTSEMKLPQERGRILGLLQTMLTERDCKVLIASYGLDGRVMTDEEIAKELGLCSERIRQIRRHAVQSIQRKADKDTKLKNILKEAV